MQIFQSREFHSSACKPKGIDIYISDLYQASCAELSLTQSFIMKPDVKLYSHLYCHFCGILLKLSCWFQYTELTVGIVPYMVDSFLSILTVIAARGLKHADHKRLRALCRNYCPFVQQSLSHATHICLRLCILPIASPNSSLRCSVSVQSGEYFNWD